MSQQVYNIVKAELGGYVKTILPELTYTEGENGALEYTDSSVAMSDATYLTTTTGQNHIVVGPHPKPR